MKPEKIMYGGALKGENRTPLEKKGPLAPIKHGGGKGKR